MEGEAECGNGALEKDPVNMDKDNEVVDKSAAAEEAPKFEGLGSNSSGSADGGVEGGLSSSETKATNVPKKIAKSKAQKDGAWNGLPVIAKNHRTGLSQSLSFPTRSTLTTNLRKGTALVKPSRKLQMVGVLIVW